MTLTSERRTTTRPASLTTAGAAAAVLAAGILVAPGVAADTTEPDSTDITEAAPALPDVREIDGSTGSLLNRDIGTGDQAFCADFGAKLEDLAGQWAVAVEGLDEGEAWKAANEIRILFTNTEAANFQCLTAAGAALTSSGNGSLIGS
ncbi:hypothetical protein PQI66_03495 [Corynebacterium sp. USCH3]|uniref:hypothetical protein n=1 Tax=Corynebacterium sp. USCH3 TaxID=3024840 RepID=UPI0030AEAA45